MAKSFDVLVKRTTTKATRDRAAARTKDLLGELLVGELRQAAGKSQRELAKVLGIKQPSLSKLEHQSDIQVSTLLKIVQALGGELDLVARFPKGDVLIRQFGKQKPKASRRGNSTREVQLF
jgi:transcriptional regulator with XRE-family HTH domain